uniref:Uncharacterized protein n=1 Tax=Anguilla anguilla TaxID=7936 RepID=A0A0E9T3W1_ANGAN
MWLIDHINRLNFVDRSHVAYRPDCLE